MTIPILGEWTYSCVYEFDWAFMFPKSRPVSFKMDGIGFQTALGLKKAENGSLNPIIHFIKIQMGQTDLDIHEEFYNWILN